MDTLLPIQDRGGPAQPLLLATGLRKHFPVAGGLLGRTTKVVRAVDDLTLSVAKGETLGVVGESGCGKSTVARLLIRLIKPDKGTMVLDGDPVDEPHGITVNELRRQVQMVFQDSYASLNPRLTIAETLAFAPRAHGLPAAEARERVRDLLSKVGLDPVNYATRYPHELSGGQRQRVNIARALALRPRLIILDEAVSALDKSVEAQVLNMLVDLKTELDLTYVFISHDLNVVQYLSDRVLVMYLGKIVELGPVEAIYGNPQHPYTRALLSARPSMDPRKRTHEAPIQGDPPNPIDPPSGCRFRTRCPFAEDVCARVEPPLTDAKFQAVACHMRVAGSGHSKAMAA
ncbi:MAG: dipeptide/oligopeptide/nickel ABC transporter ATP-binding protein [Rhodospirillales bacterium 24-66-33]|jgi:peptide/nickel transport system ATP-binding protein|uniref:ABC transporter ATP-binding protein n=1 Tax=Reyranella sp. TaxID=1929291 RepID=UPI000BD55097|nr:oligopeptide/dipeptide ABC transporter ATP-binding protein [Reyranella sp.]OYY45112.1 MAG: dipeptide/oligopeptide/nickel ABC transporter ATP-binding protein [Rhodospirillales bacterium 35-66-84]OYZ95578.1 MAG: dipeptide/oligopeptide/nickel ABC transporter ATP-binding protein [Rhodospirillales bacterium 24-66-33]OZB27096.1 MAG: dipeptide/oligopeptide/nickel ABC transporter ATP-binding protein [Rhodospirillales bacterium 39-66-50]HQS16910.1 ATP-binding cassette domain-containing protein [Reyra